jgi:hypothetical protein
MQIPFHRLGVPRFSLFAHVCCEEVSFWLKWMEEEIYIPSLVFRQCLRFELYLPSVSIHHAKLHVALS